MWEIKGKDNQVKATVGSLEYNGEWMGESYVTLTVESPAPVNFEIGDYIIYRDERFEINYDPGKIKSAPRYEKGDAFKYENIKFNSLADELTRCDFLDIVLNDNQLHFTGLPKFSFYGGVKDLANRMQANLDRTYGKGTWSVVVSPEFQSTKEVNISVDTIKVQGALSILVNELETYYTIKDRTITIGAAGIPAGHLFKYGKGNGLYEIEQNAEADQAIVTRLRAYGSTRNLPHRYYNSLSGADGKKLIPDNMAVQYLMLPEFPYTTQDPYIDSPNIAKLGIRDGSVFFDGSKEKEGLPEIYPSIEGMTAEQLKAAGVPCSSTGALDEIVSAEQMTDNGVGEINEGETQTTAKPPTFKVTLKDLGFDINDHLTTETATLSFKTGMLGGRNFEIVKNGCKPIKDASGKVTGYELELNRVYDDSIKLWFPYSAYNAQAGDKFVLLYIEMPEVYIKAAAQRLKEAATEWLSKNDYSRSIYAPKVDENFMARQHDLAMASGGKIKSLHDTLKEGMLLLFEDEDLNIDASIFIDRLTIKEEGAVPTYEVILKEEKTVGRLDKMQNQIDSLVAGKGQGGGGYTAAQIRSMIEAYGDTRFLSKIKSDRTPYDLIIGGLARLKGGAEFGEFVSGMMTGLGAAIDSRGNAEFESVTVRSAFRALEVIINRLDAQEGDTIYSERDTIDSCTLNPDGTYLLKVQEKYDGYFTAMTAGMVLKGVVNTLGKGGTDYYTSFMRVNSVNASANTMEVSLYPDDEVPAGKNHPPCDLMRVVRWGHQTDKSKQSLFYISSTEGRIIKLSGVDRPIIGVGNYEVSFGTLPEWLSELLPIAPGESGIYVKHMVTEAVWQLDHQGKPLPTVRDRGSYDSAEFYYSGDTLRPETNDWEHSDVWHNGCRWRCMATGAKTAPAYDVTAWSFMEGDPTFRVELRGGPASIRPRSFKFTLEVVASIYNEDVTDTIADGDIEWTRYTEDDDGNRRADSDNVWAMRHAQAGRSLTLTEADLDITAGIVPKVAVFTATVRLRPGTTPKTASYGYRA